MNNRKFGKKGFETEEIVRSYFLRAGFFVVRSVPLRHDGDDITDIDIWIYERSATLARRRTIIDVKDKARPQAAERLLFIKGLAELMGVDGAGVVTTDNRKSLRDLARSKGLIWLDGQDLQRMKISPELAISSRFSDEDIIKSLKNIDMTRGNDYFRTTFSNIKSTIGENFGPACANACLAYVQFLGRTCIGSHRESQTALYAGRLCYLAASIAGIALDYSSAEVALRSTSERVEYLADALRFGSDPSGTKERIAWVEAALRDYVPNGSSVARLVREKFRQDIMSVPAEGLATVLAHSSRNDVLFSASKILEDAAYSHLVPTFDELPTVAKSYMGAVLDFCNIDRGAFANSWINTGIQLNMMHQMDLGIDGENSDVYSEKGKFSKNVIDGVQISNTYNSNDDE